MREYPVAPIQCRGVASGSIGNNGDAGNGGRIIISSTSGTIGLSPLIAAGGDINGAFAPQTGNAGNGGSKSGSGGNSGSIAITTTYELIIDGSIIANCGNRSPMSVKSGKGVPRALPGSVSAEPLDDDETRMRSSEVTSDSVLPNACALRSDSTDAPSGVASCPISYRRVSFLPSSRST